MIDGIKSRSAEPSTVLREFARYRINKNDQVESLQDIKSIRIPIISILHVADSLGTVGTLGLSEGAYWHEVELSYNMTIELNFVTPHPCPRVCFRY